MTMSWRTMLESKPPLVGCVVSNRNSSFAALGAAKACVIDIPTAKLAAAVVKLRATRTTHHRGRGEFMVAGRTLRSPSRMK